ncbi:unnamed protein product [Withania somnifera]
MEVAQHRWRLRWSFKNATIIVTLFNIIAALFLLYTFFSSSSTKPSSVEGYIKEAEEIRRAMLPVELIRRVKEIQKEAYIEPDPVQQKDAKQTAAVDLITRLNNYRSYSDSGSVKVCLIQYPRNAQKNNERIVKFD